MFEGAFPCCFSNSSRVTRQTQKRGYVGESGERTYQHFFVAKDQNAIWIFGGKLPSAFNVLSPRRKLFDERGENEVFECSRENVLSSGIVVVGNQRVASIAINIDELWV